MPATNGYSNNGYSNNGYFPNGAVPPHLNPALQLTVNTVDAVTEAIKSDRTIRHWKMEAMKVNVTSWNMKFMNSFCFSNVRHTFNLLFVVLNFKCVGFFTRKEIKSE